MIPDKEKSLFPCNNKFLSFKINETDKVPCMNISGFNMFNKTASDMKKFASLI